MSNAAKGVQVSLVIENISLNYANEKQNISTAILTRGFCEMDENLLFLEYQEEGNKRKIALEIAEI